MCVCVWDGEWSLCVCVFPSASAAVLGVVFIPGGKRQQLLYEWTYVSVCVCVCESLWERQSLHVQPTHQPKSSYRYITHTILQVGQLPTERSTTSLISFLDELLFWKTLPAASDAA